MTQLLWRIEGACEEPNRAEWEKGLTLHLLFQSLTLVVARRDEQTRRYLALEGCPHCRMDGCDRMCHRTLFTQLIRTTLPGITLEPVTRLVPHPHETRRLAARPTSAAALPIQAEFLEHWSEGRLITTWSRLRAKPRPIAVGILLAVSGQGPSPDALLQAHGWAPSAVGALIARGAFQAPIPSPLYHGSRAGESLLHALRDPWLVIGPPQPAAAPQLAVREA